MASDSEAHDVAACSPTKAPARPRPTSNRPAPAAAAEPETLTDPAALAGHHGDDRLGKWQENRPRRPVDGGRHHRAAHRCPARRSRSRSSARCPAEEGLDEDESAIRPIVAEYDRLYASIVADRAVLYDQPDHPLHHQIDELLTPDSPLRPTSIPDAARRFLADPTAVRAVRAGVRALGLDLHGRRGDLEMRHSAASLFSADGVPLERVTDALGHDGTRMVAQVHRHAVAPTVDAAVAPMETAPGNGRPFRLPHVPECRPDAKVTRRNGLVTSGGP